ncbi:hypothetical protein QCM80_36665 [Bradyrhizobium sp. SSUT112]|uniref:hypothetical protein n=1 Tax=Bradyrhizobium sp. SSUT112 TaxID=3040604 RepID=UPI00244CE193|nr:hypothetical protein [Bradyrhizobium sp. SSUT112]MDH2356156.1 hypothetical protein [Bradyrhizobium sp. SSUT112]
MQSITTQLAANEDLLSGPIQEGRINVPTAAAHMMDAERLGASGIVLELQVLELQAKPQPLLEFKIELSGILSLEPA